MKEVIVVIKFHGFMVTTYDSKIGTKISRDVRRWVYVDHLLVQVLRFCENRWIHSTILFLLLQFSFIYIPVNTRSTIRNLCTLEILLSIEQGI